MQTIYPRWALQALKKYLSFFRVVCVLGPRQCGKSTMLERSVIANSLYKTLDSSAERVQAEDTEFFLKSYPYGTLMIDEVQRVPELILGIKRIVDQNARAGQFVLAGSADYRKLPSVNESLAGRAAIVNMRPLTQAEIQGVPAFFLEKLFRKDFKFDQVKEPCGKLKIFDLVIRGGFPEVQSLPRDVLTDWFSMYVENQVMRDISESFSMRNSRINGMTFLKAIALASGSVKNISDLSQDSGLNRVTVQRYSLGFESLFLINEVPAWTKSASKGLRKKPKLYMTDSGLMAHLLGIRNREQILNGLGASQKYWGALVETWVYNQIASEIDLHRDWTLYHWRNAENQEIDFLIENGNGTMLGIEVKASETIHSDDFKHFEGFQEMHPGVDFAGVVLYAGNDVIRKNEKLCAIPMSCMWSAIAEDCADDLK